MCPPCLLTVFLEVLSLHKDLLEHLIPWHRRIPMCCKNENQIYLQLSFDILTLRPIGVFRLVIDNLLYLSGMGYQLVMRIIKLELLRYGFENVIESFILKIDTHSLKRVFRGLQLFQQLRQLFNDIIKYFIRISLILTAVIITVDNSLHTF